MENSTNMLGRKRELKIINRRVANVRPDIFLAQHLICAHQTRYYHFLEYVLRSSFDIGVMAPRKEKTEKATADQGDDNRSINPRIRI